MDNKSLSHTRWKCQYHIVCIPQKKRLGFYEILKKEKIPLKWWVLTESYGSGIRRAKEIGCNQRKLPKKSPKKLSG